MNEHSVATLSRSTSARVRAPGSSAPSLIHVSPRPLSDPLSRIGRETISWKRKVFHMLGIGVVGVAYQLTQTPWQMALAVMGAIAFIFVGLDLLRFRFPALNKKVRRDFGPYMRNYELDRLSGSSWFLLASLLTISLFPREAACLGFLHLALGDPLASFVGVRWGRTRLPGGKSLEGSAALFLSCFAAGATFLLLAGQVNLWGGSVVALGPATALVIALASALAAAVAEWIPTRGRLDDNFVMPLVTAGLTSVAVQLMV